MEAQALMTREQATMELAKQEWLAKRDDVLDDASLIATVADAPQNETATATYSRLKEIAKEVEEARMRITRPLDSFKKSIMDQEKELTVRILAETARIKALCDDYATKQLQERRAAEAAAEAARRAEVEEAIANNAPVTAPAAAVLTQPPTATTASTTAAAVWKFEVTDKRMLPLEFLTVNEVAVNAALRMHKSMGKKVEEIDIPGLQVYETAQTRRR